MDDEQASAEESAARIARDAAVSQAVSTLVYIGIAAAISLVITKRDIFTRARMWLTRERVSPEEAHARREVAGLRRDLADIEHGHDSSDWKRGLYG